MENQVGRRGNVPTLLIIGYKSYIANRLSQHLKRAGINVDFLSQSGKMYSNNKVLTETSILKHRNSLKYSFIINCAGPDRNFCKQNPTFKKSRKGEIKKSYGDNTLLIKTFDFTPKVSIENGIKKMVSSN